jgi:hypothetical protein
MMNSVPILLTVMALTLSISILRLMAASGRRTVALEVEHPQVRNQDVAFLLLLVVVELEDRTAQQHVLCVPSTVHPFLNSFTIDLSLAQFSKSTFPYISIS